MWKRHGEIRLLVLQDHVQVSKTWKLEMKAESYDIQKVSNSRAG